MITHVNYYTIKCDFCHKEAEIHHHDPKDYILANDWSSYRDDDKDFDICDKCKDKLYSAVKVKREGRKGQKMYINLADIHTQNCMRLKLYLPKTTYMYIFKNKQWQYTEVELDFGNRVGQDAIRRESAFQLMQKFEKLHNRENFKEKLNITENQELLPLFYEDF